jgi:hypothetical protein
MTTDDTTTHEPPPGEQDDDPVESYRRAVETSGNNLRAQRNRDAIPDDFDPIAMHRRWMGLR